MITALGDSPSKGDSILTKVDRIVKFRVSFPALLMPLCTIPTDTNRILRLEAPRNEPPPRHPTMAPSELSTMDSTKHQRYTMQNTHLGGCYRLQVSSPQCNIPTTHADPVPFSPGSAPHPSTFNHRHGSSIYFFQVSVNAINSAPSS